MSETAPRPGPPRKSPLGEKRTAANFKLDATTKSRLRTLAELRGVSQADLITEWAEQAYFALRNKNS